MNHNMYKVIFSKTTGLLVAVSEHVSACGKTKSESSAVSSDAHSHSNHTAQTTQTDPQTRHARTIKPIAFGLMVSLGAASMVQAQIVADPNAPGNQRATILNTANGLPQVNIQTPSAAGVSLNQYKQFDVNNNGAILNNARLNTNTQTAGMVQANPNLAGGAARIIVNQVNSANPSLLNGYVEVAGQRAQVIIANPAGISVNGGGFVNASTATLTTGTPIINGGNLEGYRVTRGQVNIDGKGLDTQDADYTQILARSVQLNAGVWAKDLNVRTGANQIDATAATNQAITPTGAQPSYAIDSSALGGMYAGKITLIGTEQGLGVNNAGQISASAGNVQIDANGMLSNSGTINSNGAANQTRINTTSVNNSGTVSAQGNTQISTAAVRNSGSIAAGRELTLKATDLNNTGGTLNGQRLDIRATSLNNTGGRVQQSGSQGLALNAADINNRNGGNIGFEPASSATNPSNPSSATNTGNATNPVNPPSTAATGGTSTVVQPEPVQLAEGIIQINNGINNDAGSITANGGIDLTSNNGLTNSGTLNVNKLNVTGTVLDNRNGTITSTQARINTSNIINTAGKLGSSSNLDLTTNNLTNSKGSITADGALTSNISGAVLNDAGTIASAGEQVLNADAINNTGGTIASTAAGLTVQSNGKVNNTKGAIQSATSTKITSSAFDNTDGQVAGATININTKNNSLTNTRGTVAAKRTTINSGALSNDAGLIQGANQLVINTNGQTLANTNSGKTGGIISGGTLEIQAGDVKNTSGVVSSRAAQTVQANSISNTLGQFNSGASLNVTAYELTNTNGQITASTTLAGNVAQTVKNDGGVIASNDALVLNAGTLNNDNGQVASAKSSADITSNNAISNLQGQLQAATTLKVTGSGLDNTDGQANAATVAIDTRNQTLTNTRGELSGADVAIRSGALLNDGAGLIQGNKTLEIHTNGQTLTNANSGATGGITSGGTLSIQSGDLINNAGYIGSKGRNTIGATQITNSGQITSQDAVTITATGLDNRGGVVETTGNTSISVGNGTVNNDNGLIRSGATAAINARAVINTNTSAVDKGIEGTNVSLNANTVDNTAGAIRADDALAINSSGAVNNTNGLISSTKTSAIQDPNASKTLVVTNTNGTIIAGESNTIDAKNLTGDGKVLSNGDMSISVTDDLNNTATVQASKNLTLTSAGNISNTGKLIAGATNTINARSINNTATAEISGGTTQLSANDSITNRGLINGENTVLKAGNAVNNIGTGKIYGDHLSIGANTITNMGETVNGSTSTATIGARERLDLGAQTINNLGGGQVGQHSTIFSGNTMSIGGGLDADNNATGRASVINNESATIESLGNMRLAADQINNRNMHFATGMKVLSQERIGQAQGITTTLATTWYPREVPVGYTPSQMYDIDPTQLQNLPNLANELPGDYILNAATGLKIGPERSNYLVTPEGMYSTWNLLDYTRTISTSAVTQTDPSKIIAGGNLTLDTALLNNENSQVLVGRDLLGTAGSINNVQTKGVYVTDDQGKKLVNERNIKKGRDRPKLTVDPYSNTTTQSTDISASLVQTNTAAKSDNSIKDYKGSSLADTATGAAGGVVTTQTQTTSQAAVATGGVTSVQSTSSTDPTLIKTGAVNTNLPNSSLFSVNPNSAVYLIETDPKFANYKNWLSSDYMLGALNLDPQTMHKRLGDGFYEQKLIREQIAQLTGRRYLNGQTNDDEQYKALMSAGVTFAGQYNLRPGIALTEVQMARLTSDIVWLVEQEVTLPNGTKTTALVPKIYVAVKPGDIDGSGSLISANSINLKLNGDLNNSGTVSGRTVTQITAQNINNMGGRINADQLNLNARNDLNNIGGLIDANTSANLSAGRDVNSVTTTATAANNYGTKTIIDRVAGIYVGNGADALVDGLGVDASRLNTLSITAGNNVNLVGSDTANDGVGGTVIKAGNNLNLSTVQVANTETFYRDPKNGYSIDEKRDVGATINGVGNLKLQAGNDLNARAANVNSETGSLIATAGHDVNITAGEESRSTVADAFAKQKSFLKKKTIQVHAESDTTNSIGSNFTGNQVLVGAGNDVNIQGSNLVSDTLTWVDAKNNLNITAAENTQSTSSFKEVKKSGLMGTGGVGVMVGKTKNSLATDTTATTYTGSLIASNAGDVKLTAVNTLNIEGSDVLAANNATLVANNINIINTTDSYTQKSEQKAKSSGLTVALAGTVGDAANAAVSTVNQASAAKDRGNDRLAAAYETKAALSLAQAGQSLYQDFGDVSDASKANQGNFIGVSVSVGSSKSQSNSASSQTVANGANIAAGNNLTILATGDGTKGADGFATDGNLNVIGSNLSGKNIDISAARDVNFASAANTSTEASSNKSSSANLGVSLGVSASGSFGLSVFANAAVGKGKASGNGTSHTETQVTATDNLSVNAGRDLNLNGAQARGNSIDADVGRNLSITSLQDSNDYKSKQTSANAGVSIPIGVGSASANLGVNQQKVTSTYQSVNEQSGLFAGNGGFDVNVKGHTQLNGGAIASTAPESFNQLSTGSLGHTDIENHAEYRATSSGVNVGTGDLVDNAVKNATAALPMSGNQSDSASSTTHAVISPAAIKIGGQSATDAQLAGLSRDADTAANSLKPIFDLQKVQDDMAMSQVVGEIGVQMTGIVRTAMERDAYVANDQAMAAAEGKWKAADPTGYAQYAQNPSATKLLDYEFNQKMLEDPAFAQKYGADYYAKPADERAAYVQSLTTQGVAFGGASEAAAGLHKVQTEFGVGSPFGRAAQALTGLASGIAGGNVNQGLSAAAAPYLASAIGKHFDDLEKGPDGKTAETSAGRLLAHAAAGAAVAYASGNNAGAGAVGGVSGEAMAMLVHQQLYDGKPVSELTQAEKENIRAVATLASGLVGGVAGDGFENAATAASAGYNAAVNNQLDESSTTQLGALFCKVSGQGKCSDGVAAQEQKLEMEREMMALNPIKAGAIKQAINLGADFTPIISDIKGFAEAETVGDYIFATIGVVPVAGDAIKSARTAYKTAKAAGDVKGMKNALEDVAQACSGGSCFEAGTLVQTENGLQAIETFVGGELVWSRDEVTGAMAYKPVIATKVTADQAIYRITVQNQKGQIETFGTTSEHPFWVKDWGWIKASLLQAGTELVDGQNQTLRIIHAALTDETATVYNIEVEDYHTYHVGEIGVWVHNANCCDVNRTMLGANGTQLNSTTVWSGRGKERIDVENPAPGKRPGQVHYQDANNTKYMYSQSTNSFIIEKTGQSAPRSVQNLLNNPSFASGIRKALRYLGE
jgi:filamentous hemagglutinin